MFLKFRLACSHWTVSKCKIPTPFLTDRSVRVWMRVCVLIHFLFSNWTHGCLCFTAISVTVLNLVNFWILTRAWRDLIFFKGNCRKVLKFEKLCCILLRYFTYWWWPGFALVWYCSARLRMWTRVCVDERCKQFRVVVKLCALYTCVGLQGSYSMLWKCNCSLRYRKHTHIHIHTVKMTNAFK